MVDVEKHNREAWNRQVAGRNRWTVPVPAETIAAARQGHWSVVLTPTKPVPREWFGELGGADVLGLASAGGQQAPIFSAAGARVTVLDNSTAQLDRDREVAEREGLALRLELGSMADLSRFEDASFDLVFHPCSNMFAPDVRPVWREAFRVLRPGGRLLSGFANPLLYMIDYEAGLGGDFTLVHPVPYSDVTSLSDEERQKRLESGEPLEFGHTLTDLLGGQTDAGFRIAGCFEDADPDYPLSRLAPAFIATLAIKPL